MNWFQNLGAAAPPTRPLTLPRLLNTLLNPFAVGESLANWQKSPYLLGEGPMVPIDGGFPMWVYCEFNTLGALKTGRVRIPMPDNFRLLSYLASASVTTNGGFRVNVYDVNRRLRLTDRPVNAQTLSGAGASPLIQGITVGSRKVSPYAFQESNAQVLITIVNLEPAANLIQFGMYGVQGGKSI